MQLLRQTTTFSLRRTLSCNSFVMAFKDLRNLHLISYDDGLIDDSEFIVLYDGPVLFDSGGFLFVAQLLVLF